MIIIDKRRYHTTEFYHLKIGETFLDSKGDLCQKISPLYNEIKAKFNTVQLKTGIVSYTSDYEVVVPVAVTATYTDIF